ncbi:hypothetical protein N7540_002680 [Penicillium herquei]|nr:hypothetical protein N7540_002680 [Penicillium herquei]
MCTLGDIIQPPVNTNPALGHLFRLRKIQANIRRSLERSRWKISEGKGVRNSSLKSALDVWRQEIPQYGTSNVSCGYYHPNWMTKLYDYSILILMEDKHNFLDHEGTEDIFAAVVELVYQFRAGIMLLYLIWATRPITDNAELQQENSTYHSPEAIEACTKTLACFTDRWSDALPYLKLFEFLQQRTIWDSSGTMHGARVLTLEEAEVYLAQLKERHLHRAILGMIEDMMYGALTRYEPIPDDFTTGIL